MMEAAEEGPGLRLMADCPGRMDECTSSIDWNLR